MSLPPATSKQARIIWAAATGLAIATIVALIVALVWGLGQVIQILSPVLWPIAVAAVVACLLDPVVNWLERRKLSRTRAILCVFALATVIVAGVLGNVVPQVVLETEQLVAKIPEYAVKVETRVEWWMNHHPRLVEQYLERQSLTNQPPEMSASNSAPAGISTNAPGSEQPIQTKPIWVGFDKDTLGSITTWLAKAVPAVGSWLFGRVSLVASVFGLLAGLALVPIYAFYFLLEKQAILAHWRDYLPVTDSRMKTEVIFVLDAINDCLIAFFRGQVLVAICDGVLYTIGFVIIGLPYAVLIGVMSMGLTIIPYIGAFVTCVIALILALVNYGDWRHPLMVLAVFAVVQTLEGFVIQPKIMGHRVGLHPLAIIIALMAGTTLLGGLLGGILAIPLVAALRVVMFRYVWKKRKA